MKLFIRGRSPSGLREREVASEHGGSTPTLIFVHHGETALNKNGGDAERMRGWLDIPLNQSGREEAVRIAKRIGEYPVHQIVCSDLERAPSPH
jgi:broad specificity phosphatase PhoE